MKKVLKRIVILFISILMIGCSKTQKNSNELYMRCNDTSSGQMAETENGYFVNNNGFVFYADKSNLSTWVEVCNRPECMHLDDTCNAYLPSYNPLIQKNGKLYGIQRGNPNEGIYIFEFSTKGNGIKKVYEIPQTKDVQLTSVGRAEFLEKFLVYYGYLNENGLYQKQMISVEDNENGGFEICTLQEEVTESGGTFLLEGSSYWSIRGDDLILTSAQLEKDDDLMTTLWLVNDKRGLEKLNLPKDINLLGGYLSENIFSYYEANEGFFDLDITTGKKTLVSEKQMKDGCGWIFNEEYRIECNRYAGNKPEEAYLKFYNGEEWIDIELPEEIKNSSSAFYPIALASDRIFYQHGVEIGNEVVIDWYYFMIKEKNPELVYMGRIEHTNLEEESSSESIMEESNSEETLDASNEEDGRINFESFEPIVVFDNDNYYLEITDIYISHPYDENEDTYNFDELYYCIDVYFENKSDIKYMLNGNDCAVNGIQCNTHGKRTFFSP